MEPGSLAGSPGSSTAPEGSTLRLNRLVCRRDRASLHVRDERLPNFCPDRRGDGYAVGLDGKLFQAVGDLGQLRLRALDPEFVSAMEPAAYGRSTVPAIGVEAVPDRQVELPPDPSCRAVTPLRSRLRTHS